MTKDKVLEAIEKEYNNYYDNNLSSAHKKILDVILTTTKEYFEKDKMSDCDWADKLGEIYADNYLYGEKDDRNAIGFYVEHLVNDIDELIENNFRGGDLLWRIIDGVWKYNE